jgi:hypothetical protein
MNFVGGIPHLSSKDRLVKDDGTNWRSHMESHPTFQAYLQLKFCPRGGTVLEPFAGTASGVWPALLLGRHWKGCELSNNVFTAGKNRYRDQVKGILADGVDVDEVFDSKFKGWSGDKEFLDAGLMSQWTANIEQPTPWREAVWVLSSAKSSDMLRGTTDQDALFEAGLARECRTFGLTVRPISPEDFTPFYPVGEETEAAVAAWSNELNRYWDQKTPGIIGEEAEPVMRGTFNTPTRGLIKRGDIICLVSGIWIRMAQAWSLNKGYLQVDKQIWPEWERFVFEVAEWYTILYYTILYYTILYYTILYYTLLYYTILY